MKIITKIKDINFRNTETVAAIGSFDALHKGHTYLLEKLLYFSKKFNLPAVLITFNRYPKEYLYTNKSVIKKVLLPIEEKRIILKKMGINYLIELSFNKRLLEMQAVDFIKRILLKKCNIRFIIVGENFRFGYRRIGNTFLLKKFFNKNILIAPIMKKEDVVISTSLIKRLLTSGKIEEANELLGYNFFITGKIEQGKKIGRKIGFPTINVHSSDRYLLPIGVFCSFVYLGKKCYYAVTNIGDAPTVGRKKKLIESFIFSSGHLKSIYGKKVRIELLHKIRNIKKYKTLDNLKKRIIIDIDYAKQYFGGVKNNGSFCNRKKGDN